MKSQDWTGHAARLFVSLGLLLCLSTDTLGEEYLYLNTCKENLRNIAQACEMYSTESDGEYPSGLEDLVPFHLRFIPVCPAGGGEQYSYTTDQESQYVIACNGDHRLEGQPEGQPLYTGMEGLIYRPESKNGLTNCAENLENIGTACETYAIDLKGAYPRSLDQLVPNYLPRIPLCPSAGEETYSQSYINHLTTDSFLIFCQGHHHSDQDVSRDYPRYDSIRGLFRDMDEDYR